MSCPFLLRDMSRCFELCAELTSPSIGEIGEEPDSQEFSGFIDDLVQGAGPATHVCSKAFYFF